MRDCRLFDTLFKLTKAGLELKELVDVDGFLLVCDTVLVEHSLFNLAQVVVVKELDFEAVVEVAWLL